MDSLRTGLEKALSLSLAVCLLSVPHAVALAQSQTTGRIGGLVKDSSSAVVAGAVVTINNEVTGGERKSTTDATGNYSMPLLPPAVYRVSIAAPGFQSAVFAHVSVAVTETTQVDANLTLGPVAESITVSATPPLV